MSTPPRHGLPWTAEEEEHLKRAVQQVRPESVTDLPAWEVVCVKIGLERSATACAHHWQVMKKKWGAVPPLPSSLSRSSPHPPSSSSTCAATGKVSSSSSSDDDDGKKPLIPRDSSSPDAASVSSFSNKAVNAPEKKKPAAPKSKRTTCTTNVPSSPAKKVFRFKPPSSSSSSPPLPAIDSMSLPLNRRIARQGATMEGKDGLSLGFAVAVGVAAFFAGTFFARLMGVV